MNNETGTQELAIAVKTKVLDELREDVAREQRAGLPFISASVIIWLLISVVTGLDLNINTKNMAVFCCSCPLMPIAWVTGRIMKVDIFDKNNPLGKLGFIFTLNQMLYLLIVMWIFNAVPEKMVMVYAMVFGAHLFPYYWLYKNKLYLFSAIILPISALVLENGLSTHIMVLFFAGYELMFSTALYLKTR